MKIGLIGNMNNNNFALMRYFRDLGADAHLMLYANDGRNTLSHFTPEADTWNIEKWSPYIHRLNILNGEFSVVGRMETTKSYGVPIAILKSIIRKMRGFDDHWRAPSLSFLKSELAGYNYYIGSGISPALFEKIGWQLNLFYPYSTGIEFYSSPEFMLKLSSKNCFMKSTALTVKELQSKGIQNSSACLNSETGQTSYAFETLGVKALPLTIPAIYVEDEAFPNGEQLAQLERLVVKSPVSGELFFIHSARLFWKKPANYSEGMWVTENKNNDWFIRAFAEFLKLRPTVKATLALIEYGPDVDVTKALVSELGLGKRIIWLPKMQRKQLIWILRRSSASVGEFYTTPNTIWGGTGWEALATGTPLIQGFKFENGAFEKIFGYPPPPILTVASEADIVKQLLFASDNSNKLCEIGKQSKEWFQRYNGISMAKQWLDVLVNSTKRHESYAFKSEKISKND
jgi:glycosyltransferase involved in cell wall biosynthesis